ncbi:MAG: cobalamin-binding protein [Candidatus Omnitrophota bacterium]|nr:MAG: cobalamin-binding protein [Candidatus Omnitrophota bacterium]
MRFALSRIVILLSLLILPVSAKAETPRRIISLAPSITESLYYLGAEKELIAVSSYCNYPEGARQKEIVGTLTNPNIEKIFSLSPDLVLAVEGLNRTQTIEKLKSLGIKIEVFDAGDSFDDVVKNFVQLGRLIGKEDKAEEIVEQVKKQIKSINNRLKGRWRPQVFWQVGARPLVGAGEKSFANEFIRYGGGENIFSDTAARYPRLSREEVLSRNPDVVILVTMGDITEKEKEYWQKFKDLSAAKARRIYIVDADKVCRPTPVSFLTGLKQVARVLHPEVFAQER